MRLKFKPNFENNVVSKKVTISSFGDDEWTAESEKELLKNTNPYFEYKDLTFNGKFNVDSSNNVVVDESDGETVTLKLINKRLYINEDFEAYYEINLKDVKTSEIGTKLTTPILVAEAKSLLFAKVIEAKVKEILTGLKDKANDYEEENESEMF